MAFTGVRQIAAGLWLANRFGKTIKIATERNKRRARARSSLNIQLCTSTHVRTELHHLIECMKILYINERHNLCARHQRDFPEQCVLVCTHTHTHAHTRALGVVALALVAHGTGLGARLTMHQSGTTNFTFAQRCIASRVARAFANQCEISIIMLFIRSVNERFGLEDNILL